MREGPICDGTAAPAIQSIEYRRTTNLVGVGLLPNPAPQRLKGLELLLPPSLLREDVEQRATFSFLGY